MGRVITYHVSVGEEMPDLQAGFQWVSILPYGAGYRAESIRNG